VFQKLIFCALLWSSLFQISSAAQNASPRNAKPSAPAPASSSATSAGTVENRIEKYLRNLYAWGPAFDVKVGPAKPSSIADLLEVPVTVSMGGQSDTAVVYVSKSGDFLIRGELTKMSVDPFADARSKLQVGDSPSMGPTDAKITLFEFADFECPSCRQLDLVLRDLLPRHPEIRLVFKHYPLTNIHPWAMTAAIATQCAFEQNPVAFWTMHDAIFDAQDVISPSNALDKLQELAKQAALDPEVYRICVSNPETATKIQKTIQEGKTLTITATPTTFINGRRQVGPDQAQLEQYLNFEESKM
jgi:protein-disulfide isomerase